VNLAVIDLNRYLRKILAAVAGLSPKVTVCNGNSNAIAPVGVVTISWDRRDPFNVIESLALPEDLFWRARRTPRFLLFFGLRVI